MSLPVLETKRLRVRPLTMDDLGACHRLQVDIGWADPKTAAEETREQLRRWLNWSIANYEALGELRQPPYGDYAVTLNSSGSFIGLVGVVPLLAPFAQLPSFGARPNARFTPEMGLFWAISPAHQRQGYASEAAQALIDYAFNTLRVARLIAGTEHTNPASIGVMQKLGMRIEKNPFPEPAWFQVSGILEVS